MRLHSQKPQRHVLQGSVNGNMLIVWREDEFFSTCAAAEGTGKSLRTLLLLLF